MTDPFIWVNPSPKTEIEVLKSYPRFKACSMIVSNLGHSKHSKKISVSRKIE
jgi:hypothetical protein